MEKLRLYLKLRDEIIINPFIIKEIYTKYNKQLGAFGDWMLISNVFMIACKYMDIKLIDILYDTYKNLDQSIYLDNNPEIFHQCILTNNTTFLNCLLSHSGPYRVFQNNIDTIISYDMSKEVNYKNDHIHNSISTSSFAI